MSNDIKRSRPEFSAIISNWGNSDLPFLRRLGAGLTNFSRRFRIPIKDCCGNHGEPGCCIIGEECSLDTGDASNEDTE